MRIKRRCPTCKKNFYIWPCETKKGGKFCSIKCYHKFRKVPTQGIVARIFQRVEKVKPMKRKVLSHRAVVEKILGRRLSKNEVVHHKNEIHTDNRPENLIVFPSLSEHSKYHKWLEVVGLKSLRLINSYEDFVFSGKTIFVEKLVGKSR